MKNILITDTVKELGLEKKILKNFKLKLRDVKKLKKNDFKNIDGIITGHHINFDKSLLSKFSSCKIIVRYGAGYNNIDVTEAKKRNILVFNVPEYGKNEVADHALALILLFVKNLNSKYFNILNKSQNFWDYKGGYMHRRTSKLKIGIIGLGRIGYNLAKKTNSIGMKTFFYDPYLKKRIPKKFKKISSLSKIFQLCDIVSLHVPSKKDTKYFITEKILKKIKKNIIFINTARGDLISNSNLIKFFLKKKLMFLGLDTIENEPIEFRNRLFSLAKNKKYTDRILITPHSAFYTKESLIDLRSNAANTLKNFFLHRSLKNCVNL